MTNSIFITLAKVSGTEKCEKHRSISLMIHVTKVVLWVLMNRLKARSLMEISQGQYGFMPDRGTRNAIFELRILVERSIQKQKDGFTLCFIDYSNAFDTVKHASLFDLLSSLDHEYHDIKLLANLYWNQQAAARHNEEVSELINIKQGIRQGCVVSHLFALYTEIIMRNIERKGGFRVGGTVINNLMC